MEQIKVENNWHVLYTKPRFEKKVSSYLERIKICHYCPIVKIQKQWSDRKKIVHEPLLKSYVFVKVSEREKWMVADLPGVLSYVYFDGKPAIVSQNEIISIQSFLNEHEHIQVHPLGIISGDEVRIDSGIFSGLEAEVVSIKKKKCVLHIHSLGLVLVTTENENAALVKLNK